MVQCMSHIVRKSCQAFAGIEDGPPVAVRHIEDLLGLWIKAALLLTKEGIEIVSIYVILSFCYSISLFINHMHYFLNSQIKS